MVKNRERVFVKCLEQYCRAFEVTLESYSHDWISRLSKGAKHHVIMGYDLGLNSSSSAQVCSDKAATFTLLESQNVASIPHHLFLEPWKMQFIEKAGNWGEITKLHNSYGGKTVVKQNDGTGGRGVFLVEDINGLEKAVTEIFSQGRSVSISPFLEVEREARFCISHGRVVLCYEKLRPSVVGDGVSSVLELALASQIDLQATWFERVDKNYTPPEGEECLLDWKHNLGGGAAPRRLNSDADDVKDARDLALSAFRTLGLCAASVDVVCVKKSWMVLEVNTGIMIENAFRAGLISLEEAQEIYNELLSHLGFCQNEL